MSKIKLTGDSSGYVEISAGDNAGNNTLELPTSGTKVVASDSSNNVNGLGIVTATTFSGALSGTATTATNLADAANITTGTLSNDRLPTNINITGVITATSFSGDGSALTGIDATSLKDSGDTVRVQANTSGAVVTGVLTATSSITVGNSVITSTSISIGTTDTAGRNAGVGTAAGTIIFNTTTNQLEVYSGNVWTVASKETFTATGGNVANGLEPGNGYKYHTFTQPGTFTVTRGTVSGGTATNDIEYLIVAGGGSGGGGGGGEGGGGGAAGGLLSDSPSLPAPTRNGSISLTPGDYTITVGSGGLWGNPGGLNGSPSSIVGGSISLIAHGGGGGGDWGSGATINGGSGSGVRAAGAPFAGGIGNRVIPGGSTTAATTPQGNPGGTAWHLGNGSGGGGRGSAGYRPETGPTNAKGGDSVTLPAFNGPLINIPALAPLGGQFAGGGGGGYSSSAPSQPNSTPGPGGISPGPAASVPGPGGGGGAGNGAGSGTSNGTAATSNTGSGGGGANNSGPSVSIGGVGGSGVVVIRYRTSL